jgi:hypothetical protein
MDEEILSTFLGRDEAIALLLTEPLNGALSQSFFSLRLSLCVFHLPDGRFRPFTHPRIHTANQPRGS